jgi:hypothetical protein
MKKFFVSYIIIGKKLSNDIYNSDGLLLMQAGVVLTTFKIDLLQKNNIVEVNVAC